MTGMLNFWNVKAVKKSAVVLLAVLLVLLAVSFLPSDNTGSEKGAANEKSLLFKHLHDLDSLPPALDEKIEPEVKEQVAEALYMASVAKTREEREEKGKITIVVKATADVEGKVKKLGGKVTKRVSTVDRDAELLAVEVGAGNVAALAGETEVEKVYQKVTYEAVLDQSVPMVKADAFWAGGFKGGGVRVAVLDTGVEKSHPMLQGRVVAERDFSKTGGPDDKFGHGTHVAGIIAGSKATGGLYDGVAPEALLINAKVLNDSGRGDDLDIVAGIGWVLDPDSNPATDDGARVISMSFGSKAAMDAKVEDAIKSAVDKGAVVVVASGNCGPGCTDATCPKCGGFRGVMWPGSSPSVITVGAVDDAKKVAYFSGGGVVSGVGVKPDVSAPGVNIASSVPGGSYAASSGTSMATPHVSGAVALMLSKNPMLKLDDVRRVFERTSTDLGELGKDTSYGFGLIDLGKAFIYKEGLEIGVELEKQLITGSAQKILVTVYDDVKVNGVKATVTKPNNAKADIEFAGVGGNVFSYDYADTVLMGSYVVDVSVNYGGAGGAEGAGGEGGGEGGEGTGETPSITETRTAGFKVTSLTGDFGGVEEINVSQQQLLSVNLSGNLTFANTADVELNFSALLQMFGISNGTVEAAAAQEVRLDAVAIPAGSKATVAVNNQLMAGPGNYTLRILTDYSAGSVINETNISVIDDLAPLILEVKFSSQLTGLAPETFVAFVSEPSAIGQVSVEMPGVEGLEYNVRQSNWHGADKQLAITLFNGTFAPGGYDAVLSVCDVHGNCADSELLHFEVAGCAGASLLVVKTYPEQSVFEKEAALFNPELCVAALNRSDTGTPPASYLERFDAVIWATGADMANINEDDAAALNGYYGRNGRLLVEGSDVAFRHGSDEFMKAVLHSTLANDIGFTVVSIDELENLSMNITLPHPLLKGIGSPVFFNSTIDAFPDAVALFNGSAELAVWDRLEKGGSAIVAYEDSDSRVAFLPFSMEALNESDAEMLAKGAISWLIEKAELDIVPKGLQHSFLADGENSFAAVIGSTEPLAIAPDIEAYVDGVLVSSGSLDLGTLADGEYKYPFTATLSAGSHIVRVVVNSGLSHEEGVYINNAQAYPVAVYPKDADLVLHSLAYGYDDSIASAVINITVADLGGMPATAKVMVTIDKVGMSEQEAALAAGEEKQLTFSIKADKSSYSVKAEADPENAVAEFNESNNLLETTIYLCSRENVLVVDDNTAEFFSTPEPSSAGEFLKLLRQDGYCVDEWDKAEKGSPGNDTVQLYDAVVWSAGDYFNGTLNENDKAALSSFSGGLLIEGSDVGLDNAGEELFAGIAGASFGSDLSANDTAPEELVLNPHPITENLTALNISSEKSPYPDSVEPGEGGYAAAEWKDGTAAIVVHNATSDRNAAYYAFSIDGVTDAAAMGQLVANTLNWILFPRRSNAILIEAPETVAVNENETATIKAEAVYKRERHEGIEVSVNDTRFTSLAEKEVKQDNFTSETFEWNTTFSDAGSYDVEIKATDGALSATRVVVVNVANVNRAPDVVTESGGVLIAADWVLIMQEGEEKNFSAVASDPDGDPLTYTWLLNGTLVSSIQNFTFKPGYKDSGDYNLTLIVSDGEDEVSMEITITVLDFNTAPLLELVGNRAVAENATIAFTIAATDNEGDDLLFNATLLPEGAQFDNATATFTWTPGFDHAGIHAILFNVSDGKLHDDELVNITVENVNRRPEITDVDGNLTVNETEVAALTITAADPDGDAISYSVNDTRFVKAGVNRFEWQTSYDDAGSYVMEVNASDGSLIHSVAVEVKVDNVNRAPVVEPLPNMSVNENETLKFAASAIDPDGDSIEWQLDAPETVLGPLDVLFNNTSGSFEWTPTFDEAGSHAFVITATDGNLSQSARFNITVVNVNRRPELEEHEVSVNVMENETAVIITKATDPDGDLMNLTINDTRFTMLEAVPGGADGGGGPGAMAASSMTVQFSWKTGFEDAGTYVVEITAGDGFLNDTLTATVKVVHVNRKPEVTEVAGNLTVNETDTVIVIVKASDPDGDVMSFALNDTRFIPGPVPEVMGDSEQVFKWQTGYDDAGSYAVLVMASDGILNDSKETVVTVLNVNRPPVLSAIGNKTVNENETLEFEVEASDPDNGPVLDVGAEMPAAAHGAGFDGTTFKWIPDFDQSGDYAFKFFASDGNLSVFEEVNITVLHVNRQPVITLITIGPAAAGGGGGGGVAAAETGPEFSGKVNETDTVFVTVKASDPDGDAVVFALNDTRFITSVGSGDGEGNSEQAFKWQTGFEDSGTYRVEAMVSDGALNDTEAFIVAVDNVNRPPVIGNAANLSVDENATLEFTFLANDPDGDAVSPSLENIDNAAGILFDKDSWELEWTPTFDQSGNYRFAIEAKDENLSVTERFNITVLHVNRPPVMAAIGNKTANENETLAFPVLADDPDGDTLVFSMDATVEGADLVDGVFKWTPSFDQSGVYEFGFSAADSEFTVKEQINITVENVNRQPVITSITIGPATAGGGKGDGEPEPAAAGFEPAYSGTVNETDTVFVTVKASDPDGDAVVFALNDTRFITSVGSGDGEGNSEQAFKWQTGFEDSGTYRVEAMVSDGSLNDSENFSVTVLHVNRPPESLEVTGIFLVNETEKASLSVTATDPDGDEVAYSVNDTRFEPQGGGLFEWQTGFEDAGSYDILAVANDGKLNASKVAVVSVNNVNRKPVIEPVANLSGKENATLELQLSASDPDSDSILWSYTGAEDGMSFMDGVLSWTPNFKQAGVYNLSFTASDGNLSDTAYANVSIANVNRPPKILMILIEPGGLVMGEGEIKTFIAKAKDPDNGNVTIQWAVDGAVVSTQAAFEFKTSFNDSGTHIIDLTVTDALAASTTAQFSITVEDTLDCGVGQLQLCPLQLGVCAASFETCSAPGHWPGCSAASYGGSYTGEEKFCYAEADNTINGCIGYCDGNDNDCDGVADEERVCNTAPKLPEQKQQLIVNENETLNRTFHAQDAEGDALAYESDDLPEGAQLSSIGLFSWTPTFDQAGSYTAHVTVSDGLFSSATPVLITVSNVNRQPVAAVKAEPEGAEMNEGETKLMRSESDDPDGDRLSFKWLHNGREAAGSPVYRFTPGWRDGDGSSGLHEFILTVSDGNLTASATVSIKVADTQECQPQTVESEACGSSVGKCEQGTRTRTCGFDFLWSKWTDCVGEVRPEPEEDCGTWEDENCDGRINEGCLGRLLPKLPLPGIPGQ